MFVEKVQELFDELGSSKIMVLATSDYGNVTARSMSIIIYKNKFYFQTDKTFIKYNQIINNPNVALCFNNIQVEGACRELGHPLVEENKFFAEKFKEHFINSYTAYSHMENEVLIEITPKKITSWKYNDTPYREFLNFDTKSYYKEIYNNKK